MVMLDAEEGMSFWETNPQAAQEKQWTSDPFIGRAVYSLISRGQSFGHWLPWLFNDHFEGRIFCEILSIGCGVGDHEIAMAQLPQILHVDAFDLSRESIRIAGEKAKSFGHSKITFFSDDFNTVSIEPNKYDLILCSGSLHHVKDLEYLLAQVRNALIPGGYFIVNEYIGACYNIYPKEQVNLINKILSGLPDQVLTFSDHFFRNGTIEDVFVRDPTEAVRSKLIPDFLRLYFNAIDERKCGGCLLHPIYPYLNMKYLEMNREFHEALINTLIVIDQNLIECGQSDFSFFICQNR